MSTYATDCGDDRNVLESSDDRLAREHTGLRTCEPHYSAAEVYDALGCPYPGAGGGRL